MTSIGNQLKDSFKPTQKWVTNSINWLGDIEEFYRERAALEKEYSGKLKEICRKHFDKKAKVLAAVSVGDEPIITPGSLESASLVLWTDVLTQTELIADERAKFSHEIISKVSDTLSTLKVKSTSICKQIETIHDVLQNERTKIEDEVTKSKKTYDSLCTNTETSRKKTEKNLDEKHQRKLDEKVVEMNIGKNQYLININIANRLKDKYYYQDLPEILDYFQVLNESKTELLNKILKNANIIERNLNDHVKEKLVAIDKTVDANVPKLDTSMFINHNMKQWQEPQDFYFIPSSIWHDDESLITKEPELTTLKKILNKSSIEYGKYEESALNLKQSLEQAAASRETDVGNLTLKFDVKLADNLSWLKKFMQEDTNRVKNEVIVELIQNFASGLDLSYVEPVKAKKSRFGLFKKQQDDTDDHSLHTVATTTSTHSAGLFNLRRNKAPSGPGGTGEAMYDYEATGDDEISIKVGQKFAILEIDNNGWTLIENNNKLGLVPTSYISITNPNNSGGAKTGPSVAPKRGAKPVQYVQALYDYVASGDDEISITTGDKIIVTQQDTDNSGWTQGEVNGKRGLFPTSYAKPI